MLRVRHPDMSDAARDPMVTLEEERDLYRHERDLYRRLLELNRETALDAFLKEALAVMVSAVGAEHGYIELRGEDDPPSTPRWWTAHGLTPEAVAGVRGKISRGIIAAAVASGETILTQSARIDPRFSALTSVRAGAIEAVICAPIGEPVPCGVTYLQGRHTGRFTEEDRDRIQTLARHLAPAAIRLMEERARPARDPLEPLRQALRMDGIVGRSPALVGVLRQAALVAPLDVNVLLTGDSGTGKSQLARVIHASGPRAHGPFVELNAAALPEALLESELFGAMPGAHSTATRRLEGKVAAADGGTLFLDEIADMPLPAQAKLLQLMHSREYYPLGSNRAVRANIRIMAATNSDLDRAVAERRFRQDLLYRLQVVPLRLPTLAERGEDVAPLARHFCETAGRQHQLGHFSLSRGAVIALETTEWPGNVRQLAHAVEAAVIRAAGEGVSEIQVAHVLPMERHVGAATGATTFQQATRQFQARFLQRALEENQWDVPETARRLDIARSHAYGLIRVFKLSRNGH